MTAPVQLVFLGEVIEGFAAADVKRTLGELFKLDEARLAQMFAGGRVVINRSVGAADAPAHVARFAKLGARLHIEPLAAGAASVPAPVPVLSAPAAAVPAARVTVAAAPPAAAPALPPLEEEIVCPNCGERQSKRLLCRACATNMPMGIAAKLEAAQEARAAALDARQAGRRPAAAGRGRQAGASSSGSALWGLGFSGRVGRLAYASAGFLMLAVMLLGALALFKLPGMVGLAVFGLGLLLIVFLSVRLSALRCHDFNRSGWWSVLLLVPYVGGVVGLVLSFMPGSREENDYGEPPHDGSWALLLGSLAVVGVSAALSGSALMSAWSSGGFAQAGGAHGARGAPSEAAALELLRPPARAAYQNEYVGAPGHKAFAMSPGGAWGWKSGAASLDDAVDAALATCSANRKPYTPECVPVNVDGAWVPFETE